MTKLKLGPVVEDKPIKVTVQLPGSLHRDLVAYAALMAEVTSEPSLSADKLIAPMLTRFIATDRGFAKLRRQTGNA